MDVDNYLKILPTEILIKILRLINTLDLLNVCEAYDMEYLLKDKSVIKTINLYRCFQLKDLKFLSKKLVFEYVTTLNINGLYWVKANNLRNFIKKMTNLQKLFAIGTNLSLEAEDLVLYEKLNIKKLAITAQYYKETNLSVASVENLYLNLAIHRAIPIRTIFPNVKQIWVDFVKLKSFLEIRLNALVTKDTEKILFKSNDVNVFMYDFTYIGLDKTFSFFRYSQPFVICWEKWECLPETLEFPEGSYWRTLQALHAQTPWSPKVARMIRPRENIDDVLWDELFFKHSSAACIPSYAHAAKGILLSPQSLYLKKLSISSCLLNCETCKNKPREESSGFKKKRIGLIEEPCEHSNENYLLKFDDLEVLEIFSCMSSLDVSSNTIYHTISQLNKLHTLVLDIPVFIDGKFLIEVVKSCKHLEILKISSKQQNDMLMFNIIKSLPYARNLKDLRLEYASPIPFTKVLESLASIETTKLRRIMFICDTVDKDKFNTAGLVNLLETKPEIIFIGIKIREILMTVFKSIKSIFNTYQKLHPAKYFYIYKESLYYVGNVEIPDIHYHEMVMLESSVAIPDPYEDFEEF